MKKTCVRCNRKFKNGNSLRSHLATCGVLFEDLPLGRKRRALIVESKNGCQVCHRRIWQGKPIPLELDHVDGNADNNLKSNLRILCLNCHGQTDTYRKKNKNAAPSRKARYEKYYKAIGVKHS